MRYGEKIILIIFASPVGGEAEYADSISPEGYNPSLDIPGYDTTSDNGAHIMEFGECRIILYCYNSQAHSDLVCNIMAEGFRLMPLGLVRLRMFRHSAWVT